MNQAGQSITSSERATTGGVAVLFYRIGPYHFSRLRAAGEVTSVAAVEFSNLDPTYAWDEVRGEEGFSRTIVFRDQEVEKQPTREISRRIEGVLRQIAPSAVAIPGWYDRCSLAALRWCLANKVPAIVMSETTEWDEVRRPWKEALKRRVVRLCSSGLVGGRAHADYLTALGMPSDRVFLGYDAVDNDYFAKGADAARAHAEELRKRHGLPQNFFLASARFIPKKNLNRLLEAYSLYRKQAERASPGSAIWDLVLLGDGNLRAKLEAQVAALNLKSHAHLPGFRQYPELPEYYGLAGAFIHASTTEQWGLVVNEAMAAGLPVLVSRRCGCAGDLVVDGRNGYIFNPFDTRQMATVMQQVAGTSAGTRARMGEESRKEIAKWGAEAFGAGLKAAADLARARGPVRPQPQDSVVLLALMHSVPRLAAERPGKSPVGKDAGGRSDEYICFRHSGRNVLAVPAHPPALRNAALAGFLPFTRRRQAYRLMLEGAARTGLLGWLGDHSTEPVPAEDGFDYEAWLDAMQQRFGQTLHGAIMWPAETRRRRLYVRLLDQRGQTVAFAKVRLQPDKEADWSGTASFLQSAAHKPNAILRVPGFIAHERLGPAEYLLTEGIPISTQPLRLSRHADVRRWIAEYAGETRHLGETELRRLDWWRRYETGSNGSAPAFHQELTGLLSDGADVRRAHGDFGISNITEEQGVWWVFDWEMTDAEAPVLTDEVGFFMSYSVGKVARAPRKHLEEFRAHFLRDASRERRLAIMLALAFRSGWGLPDARSFLKHWSE